MTVSSDRSKIGSRTFQRPSSHGAAKSLQTSGVQSAGIPRGKNSLESMELAVRMLSETAHDLRSPLTTIRESVRLVHDGDIGGVNEDQQSLLMAAMDEVDRVTQMLGDMTQLERLRSGTPRTNREWLSVAALKEDIQQTLRPWAVPRGITVLWDGADSTTVSVFADKILIRRLVVNLVANAIRASEEGGTVLIKLEPMRGGETLSWSVIDQGQGIPESELERIAARHVSMAGGEGLGLAICRQLAALHFTNLSIRSRVGIGTEVSFETAASGPHSVAQAWTRWRVQATPPKHRPTARVKADCESDVFQNNDSQVQRILRLDPPVLSLSLRADASSQPRSEDRLAMLIVTLDAEKQRAEADRFSAVLQNQLSMFELAYRVDVRRWVCVLDADANEVFRRIQAIDAMCARSEPTLRINWSEPQVIPVDQQRLAPRMSDLLIRHSLNQLGSTHNDGNEVRLGTAPLAHSPVASDRLDEELRRLAARWQSQTKALRSQAGKLRPKT